MKTINTIGDLQNLRQFADENNQKIGLIPTMGALHEGHLELVRQAQKHSDIALPYIFLNPTQFAPEEDLDAYPKTLEADTQQLKEIGVEYLWLPQMQDVYPNGLQTDIHIEGLTKYLEGEHRPHFFDGVTSVVKRMFDLSKPDKVFLGEKDFQQLQVIRQLVLEYKMDIEIIGVPTIRDKNGLALSSRNAYLNDSEYEIAAELNNVLVKFAQNMITEKEAILLLRDIGFDKVDYCTAVNSETFLPDNPSRVLAAAWIGRTRLIDNMPICP